ncbi:MAG: type I-E CRISPR-associated protein Cas7/Cse4/CasC [Armatimonadota bacterium]
MLIEIHIIQNHSSSNLNRDETGSPKEAVFGGWKRARISSQCLKRSIRRSDIFQREMKDSLAKRTRQLPELVRNRLLADGISKELADIAARKASGFGNSRSTEQKADEDGLYSTAQSMFLTDNDIDTVVEVLKQAALEAGKPEKFSKDDKTDYQMRARDLGYRPITADVALFGRMITSGAFRDCEASVQVAHAISTHKVEHEYDYFTAVDDLKKISDNTNAGRADMIGDLEFNSACYYKYFSIDFDGLVSNLTGESSGRKNITETDIDNSSDLAANAVNALLKSALLITPSGKQNAFGAHQLPSLVLVEIRPYNTPVNYANAFVEPAKSTATKGLVKDSVEKLVKHMSALTNGFNLEAVARFMLAPEYLEVTAEGTEITRVTNLRALCEQVRGVITSE